jgi:hypothetical protein
MNAAAAIPLGVLASLFAVGLLLPLAIARYIGYRAGERLAIGIGAVSGLVLLLSCGLFAYEARFLSAADSPAALGLLLIAMPALCLFLGALVGYVTMGKAQT